VTADSEIGAYLARFGETVLLNGFPVIPIKPGEKRPANGHDWQRTVATPEMVRGWLGNGHAKAGVGILTRATPAFDLDIMDPVCASHMEAWVRANIGEAPVRYGQRPTRLLCYRTDTPFAKVQSRKWRTPEGHECKVEVLGDGQQFVAFHVHPDTGQPYEWRSDRGPHTVPRADLHKLDEAGARRVVAEFERYAEAAGWTLAGKGLTPLGGGGGTAAPAGEDRADDLLAPLPSRPLGLDADQTRRLLAAIPAFEGYHDWFAVVTAICHEYQDEPAVARELAHFYSRRCRNYDAGEVDSKVASLRRHMEPGAKTARLLLKLAKETQKAAADEALEAVEAGLRRAPDLD
jgi:hypothetical protein